MSEQSAYHQNEESEQQLSNHQKGEDYPSIMQTVCFLSVATPIQI